MVSYLPACRQVSLSLYYLHVYTKNHHCRTFLSLSLSILPVLRSLPSHLVSAHVFSDKNNLVDGKAERTGGAFHSTSFRCSLLVCFSLMGFEYWCLYVCRDPCAPKKKIRWQSAVEPETLL